MNLQHYRDLMARKPVPEWQVRVQEAQFKLAHFFGKPRSSRKLGGNPRRVSGRDYDVLMVSNAMYPSRGGGTRSFMHLASQLAARGLRVAAICMGPRVRQFRYRGIDYIWAVHEDDLVPAMRSITYRRLLCQQDWALASALEARTKNIPCWYFIRSVEDLAPSRPGVFSAEAIAADAVQFAPQTGIADILDAAGQVVANSRFMGDILKAAFGRESTVIYPGIDEPRPWEKIHSPFSHSIVGMAGSTKKGIQILLSLAKAFPSEFFVVCGVKNMPPNIRERDLPDNFYWLGRMSAPWAYSLAKLVLVPSQWAEPAGRVAPEAFLRGLPVLASRVGGIPEIVDHPDFLVDRFTEVSAWQEQMEKMLARGCSRARSDALKLARRYRQMQQVPDAWFKQLA